MKRTIRKILVIEDELHIRKFLRISLETHGYQVTGTRSGYQGMTLVAEQKPDLVILDLGLPDIDGQQVIKKLREWTQVPVIVLSVRSDEHEIVKALNSGANDYLSKPFGIAELMARIQVWLRIEVNDPGTNGHYDRNGLKIDFADRRVELDGHEINLTRKEFKLLKYFVDHRDKVLTHRQLLQAVWGEGHEQDIHYLRILVGHLRNKLGDDPTSPGCIVTVQGIGYRFIR